MTLSLVDVWLMQDPKKEQTNDIKTHEIMNLVPKNKDQKVKRWNVIYSLTY
mgnify:CR=1 FL=1